MPGNGRIFISHVYEDSARCQPLLAALDAWGVDYWFDTQQLAAGQHISERVQQALAERDVFLLICTPATDVSMWTGLELQAFRGLLERDRQSGRGEHRTLIYLILDPSYARQTVGPRDIVVDGSRTHPSVWFKDLRQALGVKPPARGLSRRAAIVAGATATAALAASAVAGVRFLGGQGGSKTVVVPTVHMPISTPQPEFGRLKWSFTAQLDTLSVGVANDTVYLSAIEGMYALSASAGDVKWFNSKITGSSRSVPQIVDGAMYFCSFEESLLAVNPQDGSQTWSAPIGFDSHSTPLVDGGVVYVNSSNGFVYAVNASDGSLRWKAQTGDTEALDLSSLAGSATLIYVGLSNGHVLALSKASGAMAWNYQTGGKIASSPAVVNGIVYIGSADQNIYALDATTGALHWTYKTGYEVNSSPVVADGVVYAGSGDDYLYALDAAKGSLIWKAGTGDLEANGDTKFLTGDLIDSKAIVANGSVYFTAGKYVYAVSAADGKRLWRYGTRSFALDRCPAAANGVMYILGDSEEHSLYALTLG